jgi:hypothetical protein
MNFALRESPAHMPATTAMLHRDAIASSMTPSETDVRIA